MSYITRNLKQDVTYWAPAVPDGFGGRTFAVPVALKGRWEDRTTLFIDADGQEAVSRSRVYLSADVAINGYLFLGTSTVADPTTLENTEMIKDFRKTPDLRARSYERRALL